MSNEHNDHANLGDGLWTAWHCTVGAGNSRHAARLAGAALALGVGFYSTESHAEVIHVDHSSAPLVVQDSVETTSGAPTTLDVDLDGDGDMDMRFGHVHQYAPWAGNVRTWSAINLYWTSDFDRATTVSEPSSGNPDRFLPAMLSAGEEINTSNAVTDGWSGSDPAGWIAARYFGGLTGNWYSTDGTSSRGYIGFQTADGNLGWIDLEARHDNLDPVDSANNHLIIHGWAYQTEVGVPIEAGSLVAGPPDADGDGIVDDEDQCAGFDDAVYAPDLSDNVGFDDVSIDIDGEDVVISWGVLATGTGNMEIWRATDPDDLPSNTTECVRAPGATAESVYAGNELVFTDVGAAARQTETPTYFYRIISDGVEVDSMVLAKVTTQVQQGYNLLGLCMVDSIETVSDADALFGDTAATISVWNPQSQNYRYWHTSQNAGPHGDFDLPFGGLLVVDFDGTEPYQSIAGRVPTTEVPLAAIAGRNELSWPLITNGYEPMASEHLGQSGFSTLERWDTATSTSSYYSSPGDPDFQLVSCGGYGFHL